MSRQRVLILLWQYLLVKEEELFYLWDMSKFLLVALIANVRRVDVTKINFQFEIGPFWDSNHENVHCIFLTFLENKRFFARTLFTSDYLSTLKLSMDKNEGNRFLNSWCSIFPDRCSLSLEVIFLALLPTWGENLLCLLKKAQQREQQKSLFFLNSTFYRSAWAWRVFMIFNNSSGRKL